MPLYGNLISPQSLMSPKPQCRPAGGSNLMNIPTATRCSVCATLLASALIGCGQTGAERAKAGFRMDQAKKLLAEVRSRFDSGVIRTHPRDLTYENTSLYVTSHLTRSIRKRVPDKATKQKLLSLAKQLAETYQQQVRANVETATPDFPAGIAGVDECVKIIEQMEAILRE